MLQLLTVTLEAPLTSRPLIISSSKSQNTQKRNSTNWTASATNHSKLFLPKHLKYRLRRTRLFSNREPIAESMPRLVEQRRLTTMQRLWRNYASRSSTFSARSFPSTQMPKTEVLCSSTRSFRAADCRLRNKFTTRKVVVMAYLTWL